MPRLVRGQAANKAQNQFSVDVETLIVMISHYWEMIIWRSANTARRLLEGKQTAVDKSRKGELFVEESDVLVWLERERHGSSCITWVQSLKIHNILLSRGHPTHWRTEMCAVMFFSWCRLGKNLKNNNNHFPLLKPERYNNSPTHPAWTARCPHFLPVLLGMSWISLAPAPDPEPQRNTFSVKPHKRCSQCVCRGKYGGLTKDYLPSCK